MSDVNRTIRTTFAANAGNLRAVLGEVRGGLNQLTGTYNTQGRQVGYLNNQLRALGTTMRYALAGSVVFGAVRMVTVLQETQRQLALIGFLGQESFGGLTGNIDESNRKLDEFYQNAQRGAMQSLTPVKDFNDGLINLFSTVQNLDPDQAVKMTTAISQGAQLAQVDTEELTKTIAGLTQSFGLPHTLQNYQRGIRGFVKLISEAPGAASFGPQIAQQIPQLSAVSRLANITPQQMLGLYLTTLRAGGSPSTTGRGLQYLLQSVAIPQSKEAQQALAQAGITPTTVQQRGGLWAINQLINYSHKIGALNPATDKRIRGLSADQLDILDQSDPMQALTSLGISGQGLNWIHQAIGRIHGVRALVMLQEQRGRFTQDIATIQEAMSNSAAATHEFARAWSRFAGRQPLQAAQISLDVLQRQIISAYAPFINLGARGINFLGGQAISHPGATQHAAQAGGVALLLYSLARMRGGSGLLGGVRGLTGGFAAANTAEAALKGSNLPGYSPQNPLYVVVVWQMGGGGRGPGGIPEPVPTGRGPGGGVGRAGRLARLGRFLAPEAGGAALSNPITAMVATLGGLYYVNRNNLPNRQNNARWHALWPNADLRSGRAPAYLNLSPTTALTGKADVTVDFNLTHEGGVVKKRVHVPLTLAPFKNGVTPSSRGQSKTQRKD